jgi:hypothetical protein
MAVLGQETAACEKGERMGNNATSFVIVVVGGSDGLIQAAQGQWWSFKKQGCGARWDGPIKQRQQAPPNGGGEDSDGITIAGNNTHQRLQDWDNDQIGLQGNAATTTTMTIKGADDHDEEDPPKGKKYARRAEARRRDWYLPRRYVARLSRLKVDDGNAAFLLMAEATVMTTTELSLSLEVGRTMIILGLLLLRQCPG